MVPSIGRIVQYTLAEHDALAITSRRQDAQIQSAGEQKSGFVVHVGNPVHPGETYPLLITRVWDVKPSSQTAVNGQVLLDGNDTLWVTSRVQGDAVGQWKPFPRT